MSRLVGRPHPGPSTSAASHRDSLELASLASSQTQSERPSLSLSSDAGPPSSRKLSSDDSDPLVSDSQAQGHARSHDRSFSVSSAFDFAPAPLPGGYTVIGSTTTGRTIDGLDSNLEKQKTLTYLNGLSLIVGLVIGSGVFSSPAQVNANAGSRGAALVVWLITGLLAWTGAASYAELGGAIPLNGGAQVYLDKIYGQWAGFLFTWCAITVLKPGSGAIIAIILGEYLVTAFDGSDAINVNPWISKSVALLAIAAVTLLNCTSTKLTTKGIDFFMFFKFAALLTVTVVGIVVAAAGKTLTGRVSDDWKTTGWFHDTKTDPSSWAVAIYAGLWAYDGWDNTNYVAGEFINPRRDLPRTIHTALPVVIIAYFLANMSYFFVLPLSIATSSNTIGVAFANYVFGPIGGLVIALVVAGSCFGSLTAQMFTTGRLIYGAGRQGYLPRAFGQLGLRPATTTTTTPVVARTRRRWKSFVTDDNGLLFHTPVYAQLLNAAMTTVYVIVGDFGTLTIFYGLAMYVFYFATVLGLVILRVREPALERPYRCWITTPVVFCCVSLFLISRSVFATPLYSLVVVAFLAAGVPVYWWRTRYAGAGADGGGIAGKGSMGGRRSMRTRTGSVIGWRVWRHLTG